MLLFLAIVTYPGRPGLLFAGLAAAPLALAATSIKGYRPPAEVLFKAMAIALPFAVLFYHRDSLWLASYSFIPGAIAIRAIGRIVLIMLLPAGLGLACLVEFFDRRRLAIAAWSIAFVCLAEQGVTTNTFDAAENRASIENLASRIDRTRIAFYYHPLANAPYHRAHLDAMWASLETGVPTVNGYSGHNPRSWSGFAAADTEPKADVQETLAAWEELGGLRRGTCSGSRTVGLLTRRPSSAQRAGCRMLRKNRAGRDRDGVRRMEH